MIRQTFVHISGIGPATEQLLWESGIRAWEEFLPPYPRNLSRQKTRLIEMGLESSPPPESVFPSHYAALLPPQECWRLFSDYRGNALYLDIETTGLAGESCEVTTIATWDGRRIRLYVQGENLADFPNDLCPGQLLVTYNGATFDLPILRRAFGIALDQAHIDLRHLLHRLGIRGGLKACERQLGITRPGLEDVDGYFAVLLWNYFHDTGDRRALETLLAYNAADSVSLELLMVQAFNSLLTVTPFAEKTMKLPSLPSLPYDPCRKTIHTVRKQYGLYHTIF